jgi:hypothetical protein
MSSSFEYLTPEYRARLRPAVDVHALERFLAAISPNTRLMAILTFVRQVTVEDMRHLNEHLGDEESNRHLDQLLREPPLPPSSLHEGPPGTLAFETLPSISYVVQLEPPHDPQLLPLWQPIEPGFTDRDVPRYGAV